MSLLRNITLAATIAAAGCSSYPDYDVKRRAQPLVQENYTAKPVEAPKEIPKEVAKPVKPGTERVFLAVVYEASDKQTASLVRGYAALTGQHNIKAAFSADKDKSGVVSYEEITDAIIAYTKEHGGEIKLLPVKDGRIFSYSTAVNLPAEGVKALKERYDKENAYGRMELLDNWEKMFGDEKK
jgi:hypothetical protein